MQSVRIPDGLNDELRAGDGSTRSYSGPEVAFWEVSRNNVITNALLATNSRFIGYSELGTLAPVQAIQIGSFLVRE
jgi:hypothetical protein